MCEFNETVIPELGDNNLIVTLDIFLLICTRSIAQVTMT